MILLRSSLARLHTGQQAIEDVQRQALLVRVSPTVSSLYLPLLLQTSIADLPSTLYAWDGVKVRSFTDYISSPSDCMQAFVQRSSVSHGV